jgi:threonylcarbamoyladenosine tRNA methylthiotransferase MtaB
MSSFYVESFGCRATQADSAAIERELLARGLCRSETPTTASVVVLNTCTVTAAADHDARSAIRRLRRENPDCKIMVTGCYAQRAPQEIAAIEGVTWVVGNSHKHRVAEIACGTSDLVPLTNVQPSRPAMYVSDIFAHTELIAAPVFESESRWERTRPNLKVQDGCNNRCSFCVIPYVRGRSRSLPLGHVLREADALVAAGYRELVLSGINLGRWGRDFGGSSKGPKFVDLVRALLERTAVEKLRISSVEPMDWSDELIDLMASSPRIARHAHVPLQSGSDRVLRRMHRKYRPWHYAGRLERIRAAMPSAAIGADVMVGFPGETDEEFEETRRFISSLPFTYLHVFTFSARPGTPAATMPNQVLANVTRERNRVLRDLAAEKNRAFRESFVGRTVDAITLERVSSLSGEAATQALTDNYLKLHLGDRHEPNRWVKAYVEGLTPDGLLGHLAA